MSAFAGQNTERKAPSLLQEIEEIAARSAVSLVYVRPAVKGERADAVHLECDGRMPQLITFLHSIEVSERFLRIDKFDLTPKSDEPGLVRCTMAVSEAPLAL